MGRRALRKIDPGLVLANHLKVLEDLPRPWDVPSCFPHAGPLEIEVGSGKGLFLENASGANPGRNYVGIEVSRKYARFAAARLARVGRENAMVVLGDGLALFRECLADASVEDVHVYFPDPWWKKRHKKRRVMTEPFLADVERVLTPSGTLHFWTDVLEYFEATLELIQATTSLAGPSQVTEAPAEHDMDYRTHFERRMRLNQQAVYRARFASRR